MSRAPTNESIRLYCDGELTPQEAQRIEQQLRQDPHREACAEFERRLHEHVGAVLRQESPSAPPDLAGRVRRAMTGAASSDDPAPLRVGPRSPAGEARRWWHGPNRANVFAVAASLALVAGMVLFGIFGPQIDSWRGRSLIDVAAEAAAAVAGEHVAARSNPDPVSVGLAFPSAEAATRGLAPFLDGSAAILDLSHLGYEFVGGSMCHVPHCERGCHLIFRRGGDRPGLITLHIAPEPKDFEIRGNAFSGSMPMMPIKTDIVPKGLDCPMEVVVWTHGNRSFMLAVCVSDDVEEITRHMQTALTGR